MNKELEKNEIILEPNSPNLRKYGTLQDQELAAI